MEERLDILEYAVALALVASLRSEDPFRRVGACALNAERRVIGLAYNGLPAGVQVEPEFWHDREKRLPYMLHAEQNLCSLFTRGEAETVGLTCMPCSSCARLLTAYGVKHVAYLYPYERDDGAAEIFRFSGVSFEMIGPTRLAAAFETLQLSQRVHSLTQPYYKII